MKKTMLATALGLALMPFSFAAQTAAKPATGNQPAATPATSSSKPANVKKHKHHVKKPATKSSATTAPSSNTPKK